MNKLEVSIGLPTRNGEKSIKKSVESLLSQSFKDFELIISDNASLDHTEKICKRFAKRDKRIIYIRQKRNIGPDKNFMFVLKKAKGKYFMWAADDDWWDPNFISRLKKSLDQHLKYGVAMSSCVRIYENGEIRDKIKFSSKNSLTKLSHFKLFTKMIRGDPIHIFIYGLFRSNLLKKMTKRPFPKCMAADRVFMCQTALTARFYSLSDFLYFRRVYKRPVTERHTNSIGNEWANPRANAKYIMTLLKYLITSDTIPVYRKFWIIPIWLLLIWKHRNLLVYELFPKYNQFRKKIDVLIHKAVG